jgi:probable phosphoglycerate mutase
MKLYLVRHGETEWSLSGQHTGRTDIPLTHHGEEEAQQLASWLKGIAFSAVWFSPRQRARRTCELAGLGGLGRPEPALAEWDYGEYEGLRSDDIAKKRPGWNIFRDGCPNGESPEQIVGRADQLIARLDALDGNVALFSHGHFSRVLAVRWIGLSVIDGQLFSLGTGSLSILQHDPRHPERRVIALWNAQPAALGHAN